MTRDRLLAAALPAVIATFIAAFIAAFVALGGCTSVPQASPERDAEAKQFDPHPGAATIYVYRPDFMTEGMEETVLYVDSRLIGSMLAGAYFRVDVRQGAHVLQVAAPDVGRLRLDVRPGEIYFVSLNVVGGNSSFRLEDAAAGKRRLARCCALFENWQPGQRPLLR